MITRYRMSINGTQLDSCLNNNATYKKYKDKIVLLNIGYSEPGISRTVETAGDTDGGIITRTYRQKATVTVTFGLYIYDVADRKAVCRIIQTLVRNGGTIQTNDRPGEALYNCVCEQFPEIDSARDWTAPLTMVFSAYAFPYWQDTAETRATIPVGGTNWTSKAINVPGNAPKSFPIIEIVAKADFTDLNPNYKGLVGSSSGGMTLIDNINTGSPSGGTILPGSLTDPTFFVTQREQISVAVSNNTYGQTTISSFYPLKKNNCMVIDTDARNNLRIRIYASRSNFGVYGNYLASGLGYVYADKSNDLLIASPGESNTFKAKAEKQIDVFISVKGAWL